MRQEILEALDGTAMLLFELAKAVGMKPVEVSCELVNDSSYLVYAHIRNHQIWYSRRSPCGSYRLGDHVAVLTMHDDGDKPKCGVVIASGPSNQTVPAGMLVPFVYKVRLNGDQRAVVCTQKDLVPVNASAQGRKVGSYTPPDDIALNPRTHEPTNEEIGSIYLNTADRTLWKVVHTTLRPVRIIRNEATGETKDLPISAEWKCIWKEPHE